MFVLTDGDGMECFNRRRWGVVVTGDDTVVDETGTDGV